MHNQDLQIPRRWWLGAAACAALLASSVVAVQAMTLGAPPERHDALRLRQLRDQIWMFHDSQAPPALPARLEHLLQPPHGELPYARGNDLTDAQGRAIAYEPLDARRFRLRAPGPDGRLHSPDDLTWEE
jgi:hypothetical protein